MMKLNLNTKKQENKEQEMRTVHLSFDSEDKGLTLSKDVRDISSKLVDYMLISDSDNVQLWFKDINGDVYTKSADDSSHAYLVVYHMDVEYVIECKAYQQARDFRGNKYYDYMVNVHTFLKNYSHLLAIFNVIIERLSKP